MNTKLYKSKKTTYEMQDELSLEILPRNSNVSLLRSIFSRYFYSIFACLYNRRLQSRQAYLNTSHQMQQLEAPCGYFSTQFGTDEFSFQLFTVQWLSSAILQGNFEEVLSYFSYLPTNNSLVSDFQIVPFKIG